MKSMYSIWLLLHLIGLACGMGAATVKLSLLARCRQDGGFVPHYLKVMRPITRFIILGMILLTISGVGWLLSGGYSFTPMLITKLVLVAALWVIGPVIDNVFEPRFAQSAPQPGETPSQVFLEARDRLLAVEVVATALFYVVTILGVWLYP